MTRTAPAEPVAEPGPRRVVHLELSSPDAALLPDAGPDLVADDVYESARVIATWHGRPVGDLDVRLTSDPADARAALAPLRELAAQAEADEAARPPRTPDDLLPAVTVVVSTIVGRREDLELMLDGFARVDYPDVEFLIVDNRPVLPADDVLPGLVAGRDRVRAVHEPRKGISAGRNAGVAEARGEIVVFTDDDVRVEPDWLRELVQRFVDDPQVDAVTGLILPAELDTPAQIWFERYYGGFSGERAWGSLLLTPERARPERARPERARPERARPERARPEGAHPERAHPERARPDRARAGLLDGARVRVTDRDGRTVRVLPVYGVGGYGAGANMAFRRTALRRIGGFDLALGTGTPARGGEDLAALIGVLWTGGRLAYEPAAVVHHRHRRGTDELLGQLRGNGLGMTAMLSSLVLNQPRHVLGLARLLPPALVAMASTSVSRIAGGADRDAAPRPVGLVDAYPRSLLLSELSGYPRGPLAYLRSRRLARADSWVAPDEGPSWPTR